MPNGFPLSTDFFTARELFRQGKVRLAITQYRKALRFESNAYERARAYLELARIYRISVRMKNARLELMRCFAAAGLNWPSNTWTSLASSWINPDPMPRPHADFAKQSRDTKIRFVAELYEEVGLSAYYLRHIPTLLQTIIRVEDVCQELGPSRSLLNWYGGAACIWSLMGFRKKSLRLIKQCHDVSTQLPYRFNLGKALMWEALLSDYHGQPMRSAELFEQCLNEYGGDLYPFNLRLAAITLSINYLSRGHYEKALSALNRLADLYPHFQKQNADDWSFDSAAWYALAPKVMLGQMDDIDKMANAFRSLLSVDKDEKWLLTQFLGHLLIAGRQTGMEPGKAEDLISRFEVLGMSARNTHLETSVYWIAAAYIRFDFAGNDQAALQRFRASLKMLGQTPDHPTSRTHYEVLQAGLSWLQGRKRSYLKWATKAAEKARLHDNRWALVELGKLQSRVEAAGGFH